jgi:Ferritin-like domain
MSVLRSRRAVLRGGAAGGAALIAGGTLFGRLDPAAAAPSQAQDAKIFNFALLLEYLQAAFYAEAVAGGNLTGEIRDFAEVVSQHEAQHVAFLQKALGQKARKKPAFKFGDATKSQKKVVATAVLLENIGVGAYNGQASNLTKGALAPAASIVGVEAGHAAWISDLAGENPAPRAADPGMSAAEVIAQLRRTGFVTI